MARIKLELDIETFGRLVESAVAERRPADMQAEVVLMRALGTYQHDSDLVPNVVDEKHLEGAPNEGVAGVFA
jgi:hypothetical protein